MQSFEVGVEFCSSGQFSFEFLDEVRPILVNSGILAQLSTGQVRYDPLADG